ncbi:MAG: tetratricopeptide repeat protein [Acidobacteria bacterium]|nr:tetratricopeptide repeat protein [Acidobacteriota bacterium]
MRKHVALSITIGVLCCSIVLGQGRTEIQVTTTSATAQQFYEQGLAKLDRLENAAASELFQKAIEADPSFAMAYLLRGVTAGGGQLRPNLQKAVESATKASEAERLLIQAYQLNTSDQPDKAIEALIQVIKLQPMAKRGHQLLGSLLANRNRLDEALIHLNKAVELDANYTSAYTSRGTVLINQGKYGAAQQDYRKALSLVGEGPARINVLSQLALAYAAEGNTAEAAKYYEEAIGLADKRNQPATVAAFCNALGRIYLEHGDLINANKLYQRGYETAMKSMPEQEQPVWRARYWHARARILARVGEYNGALAYANKIKSLIESGASPQDHLKEIHHYLVGYIKLLAGEYDAALEELRQGNDEDAFIQVLIAQAYEGKGDKAEAAKWYQKVLEYHGGGASTVLSRPLAEKWMKQMKSSN